MDKLDSLKQDEDELKKKASEKKKDEDPKDEDPKDEEKDDSKCEKKGKEKELDQEASSLPSDGSSSESSPQSTVTGLSKIKSSSMLTNKTPLADI